MTKTSTCTCTCSFIKPNGDKCKRKTKEGEMCWQHGTTKSNKETCSICLCDCKTKKTTIMTKCGHRFHKDCLNEWVNNGTYEKYPPCPMCRIPMTEYNARQSDPLPYHDEVWIRIGEGYWIFGRAL